MATHRAEDAEAEKEVIRTHLTSHPNTPCPAIARFAVDVALTAQALELRYIVSGDIETLRIPPRGDAVFPDELWRHTCFELFIANEADSSYLEFNFSPSGAWAAYRFSSYRSGMTPLSNIVPPRISVNRSNTELQLTSIIAPDELTLLDRLLGITAVLEQESGALSYWALKHSAGKADFHWRKGFSLRVNGGQHPSITSVVTLG